MSFFGIEKYNLLEDVWKDILPKCSTNTIFITPTWQSVWWRRFAGQKQPIIRQILSDGDPIGIIPFLDHGDELTFIGDSSVFDYMDFPVVSEREEEFFSAAWIEINSMDWVGIRLESIPEDSPTIGFAEKWADSEGYSITITETDKTPYSDLPKSWEEYLLNLRKKDRHELRRKIRRLEATPDYKQSEASLHPNDLKDSMDEFFRLMSLSGEDKEAFLNSENKEFFIDLASTFSENNMFKLYFLEIEKTNVAACICFDYDNKCLLYNSGYDPSYSSLSVGLINKAFTIEAAISNNNTEYNFLKGTERYKYHLGASDRSVFKIQIAR